nr:MAG TPA: hypothetical protein [Caudoviricetes sp.]
MSRLTASYTLSNMFYNSQTKGNFSGCLFFLPCSKSTTYPGMSYKISEKL